MQRHSVDLTQAENSIKITSKYFSTSLSSGILLSGNWDTLSLKQVFANLDSLIRCKQSQKTGTHKHNRKYIFLFCFESL